MRMCSPRLPRWFSPCLALLAIAGCGGSSSPPTGSPSSEVSEMPPAPLPARVAHFPQGVSHGDLKTRPDGSPGEGGWEALGEAHGAVEIPSGRELRLHVSWEAGRDLTFLAALDPGALQGLSFTSPLINDGHLRHLLPLTGLRDLELDGTQITDRGLASLAVLVHLNRLDVSGTGVTRAGIQRLQLALPHCRIIHTLPEDAPIPRTGAIG